jgi:hypothetical protein
MWLTLGAAYDSITLGRYGSWFKLTTDVKGGIVMSVKTIRKYIEPSAKR